MVIDIFGQWINSANRAYLQQCTGPKETMDYGVRIYFAGDKSVFLQGRIVGDVAGEINYEMGRINDR